ncbi:NAD(P)H-binding protein [Kribbella sp. NBC_01484]|uniref:NAD(P)H-binding protein n=1 Tax=Kribbella sp. NBC_01484 TaxID=2903579 RepID=UPI002E30B808|nr:NAD(P)H-binding protein [Kribbella sp. NBC_01484]
MIGVTAATGGLGSRIARRLADSGVRQRLIVRDPGRAPSLPDTEVAQAAYGEHAALLNALDGVDTLMLLSATESADRVALHKATVDAAVAAGVRRIVYTSFAGAAPGATFTFARDHWHTEQHIRSTGVGFTFLRDNLYIDFVPGFAGEDGVIRGPAGDGRTAAVARDDVAAVAARVLVDSGALRGDVRPDRAGRVHARRGGRRTHGGVGAEGPLRARDAGRGVPLPRVLRRSGVGGRRVGHVVRRDRERRAQSPLHGRRGHHGCSAHQPRGVCRSRVRDWPRAALPG